MTGVRWGFRGRLLLATAGLVLVAVLVGDLLLGRALERDLIERTRADLQVRLELIEAWMRGSPLAAGAHAEWDALADGAAQAARARVTFIDSEGQVLGDSEVSLQDLPRLENHSSREEVQAARAVGQGWAERRSATVDRRLLYLAKRSTAASGQLIILRAAVPLTSVEEGQARLRRLLVLCSGLAMLVALLLSLFTGRIFGRSLRNISDAAAQIAGGNLDVRIRSEAPDEIGQLAGTLDHLTESLASTLKTLREERDRLGRILEAMEEGVLVLDSRRVVVMANPAARVLLLSAELPSDEGARKGFSAAPLEGKSLLEVVRSASMDTVVGETLTTERPASGEITLDRPRFRRLLVHAAPLSADGGGALVVLVDVTEIRRLEAIRKDFVANVSHELRTPLTAVRTALETAQGILTQDPAAASRFLAIADRQTERLTTLVRDLLDLSRIEAGKLALVLAPVDTAEVAAEVVALFQVAASRRQLRLSVQVPAELPPVQADREALVQVLTNLLENAVKYCEERGTVTLRGHRLDGQVCLVVEDSGPGIAPKHLPRLFERFYRVDAGRSRERGGTGLGLSIVKHLVEAMDGEVSVESEPGRGSRFSVRLPVSAPYSAGTVSSAGHSTA